MSEEIVITEIVVGEKTFVIGKPSAAQVAGVARNFAKMNLASRGTLSKIENPTDMDYIMSFLANIDEATLIELAALSIGSDRKFAEENFDLDWVVRALVALVRNSNLASVIANFTSILVPTAATLDD
jgi:hypothetical protein